ncbi:hypothetical protein [Micromonospora sp. NPDC048063]|uniref:hypothetical protein n=1 Tax=Micromonospora sp. NPDC048063 TaxID=3364256 RepID=UPI0037108DB5
MAEEVERAVRRLCERALTGVGRWSGRTPLRDALYRVTRGRIDKRPRYSVGQLPTLATPWQDTASGRYFGWRCRQANLHEEFAFAVEYIVCPHCGTAWVDKPYTAEEYQRRGLAAVALWALREENPGLYWYTGSGHLGDAKTFWNAVGRAVPGAYRQHELCEHIDRYEGLKPNWLLRRQQRQAASNARHG